MCPSRPSEVKMNEKLLRAAQQGDAETVTNILDSSVSVKECLTSFHKKSGDTAAHLAARHGHVSILTVLNSFGASFEMENLDGKRALHEAAISGQDDCVKYLLSVKANVDPLKRADWTPLMLACTKSNLRVIQELVNHGADLRLRNKDGWNCFHIAAREGHTDILKYILDCNNDIWDTVSKNGRTPLHTAALHGNLEAVKLFLQQCTYKVDSVDSCGTTPLMDAIRTGFIDTADALIDIHKADHMKSDTLGRQALHLAAQAGCEVSIHFLIEKCGAPVNSVTAIGGLSPLHLAAKVRGGPVWCNTVSSRSFGRY
ncbi:ankyrin repeat domain-containing protein 16-like isoform X2 [Ptychodera flava]|uniref:ankyrin repeat domain-containing protein 16-like isoform X2 n=1 Tax=Ptychodera flava TaxID=63121 RepID=UPI003969E1BD